MTADNTMYQDHLVKMADFYEQNRDIVQKWEQLRQKRELLKGPTKEKILSFGNDAIELANAKYPDKSTYEAMRLFAGL
jgi:hypothetical protein